jgi:hypothetical protein
MLFGSFGIAHNIWKAKRGAGYLLNREIFTESLIIKKRLWYYETAQGSVYSMLDMQTLASNICNSSSIGLLFDIAPMYGYRLASGRPSLRLKLHSIILLYLSTRSKARSIIGPTTIVLHCTAAVQVRMYVVIYLVRDHLCGYLEPYIWWSFLIFGCLFVVSDHIGL